MSANETVTFEWRTYHGPAGDVPAYLARPTGDGPWPALLVIHEIFGLVHHIEQQADRFARAGYLALAPDLYTHDRVRPTLTERQILNGVRFHRDPDPIAATAQLPPEEQADARRVLQWLATRDTSTYVPDLHAGLRYVRSRPDVRPDAVGAVGWCFGGVMMGLLITSGADLAAAVIYYGEPPPLDQVGNVTCPVQGHYGGDDRRITDQVPGFEHAMRAAGKSFTAYVYPGAPHAFQNDEAPFYTPDAARTAWERTITFFDRHLRSTRRQVPPKTT